MSKPSRSATARLFVAVDPPGAVCEQLAAWARAVAGGLGADARVSGGRAVRVLEPDSQHLTLAFLSSRPVAELETIADAVRACRASCGELAIGAPLWLPPRRPHALALAIHDRSGELARLHERVLDALADAIDWAPERRRFRAHVTVARIGRGSEPRRRRRAAQRAGGGVEAVLPPTPQLAFTPRELVLYRSWLDSTGARYEPIATRTLENEGASSISSSSSAADGAPGEGEPAAPGAAQTSIEPSSAGVGREPSSHSGAEPSSQA